METKKHQRLKTGYRKLQKIHDSYYVSIPIDFVNMLQLKQGDPLKYKITPKGNLLIGK